MRVITKFRLFFGIFLIYCSGVVGQTANDFEIDFNALAQNGFPKEQIDTLLKKYETLIHGTGQDMDSLSQHVSAPNHPLKMLLRNKNYLSSINSLLMDSLVHRRNFALSIVGAVFDKERIPVIENICKNSNYQNAIAATVLGVLKTTNLDPIVKTLVAMEHNETATQYIMTFFLKLETKKLDQFFMDSVASKNPYMGFLAIKAANAGPITKQKELKLREVVRNNVPAKGWAISLLAEAGIGNIYPLVSDFINEADLREVAIRALANSSSPNDIRVLDSLISNGPATKDLLHALINSSRTQTHLKWIDILRGTRVDTSYYPFINRSKLKHNNEIYSQICSLIKDNLTNDKYYPLFNYFENRLDDRSTAFLLSCLTQPIHGMQSLAILQVIAKRNKVMIANAIPKLVAKATDQKPIVVRLLSIYQDYRYAPTVALWLNEPGLEHADQQKYREYLDDAEDAKLDRK